ncbi:DUF1570 domain-containing protein [Thiorhodococcus minor]|uniref:DUF1570 domain-containing protein n=1 Tax=Thiorhodococcus minor TaxID=57489 RepID=A0A6M0K4F4_9GAMM|nr:DUF1570 domain-containing protein [Thiorhodococcus minor]NEV64299.1 DUF1570 domain-containing protein [Thiorhodococcus minor]
MKRSIRKKPAQSHRGGARGVAERVFKVFVLILLSTILAWLISTNDQRLGYLAALGRTDLTERLAGQELILSGPGFEYSLIRFPPKPVPMPQAPRRVLAAEPGSPPEPERMDRTTPTSAPRDHADIGRPCLALPVLHPSRKQAHKIYRWTDASGKVIFSDRRPAADSADVVGQTADGGVGMFSAEYSFVGHTPDPAFRLALAANVNGVFQFLAESIGEPELEPLHVRLTIIEGAQRFIAYRETQAHNLATVTGFYSFLSNEAVVRWMGAETSMAVARHEITHLALGNWLGNVPLWLNEGLAEFVERLSFRQSYATASAPLLQMAEVAGRLEAGRLPSLGDFLAMNRDDWNRIGDDIAYGYAWSLAHFLMERPERRRLIGSYLGAIAEHRCRGFDAVATLEATYPGGLAALEADWSSWLRSGDARPFTF